MDYRTITSVMCSLVDAYIMNQNHIHGSVPKIIIDGNERPESYRRPYLDAMVFFITIRCANYGYESDGNTHHEEWERSYARRLIYIVTERHNVFLGTIKPGLTDEEYEKVRLADRSALSNHLDLFEWINTSNHDSCWRSDGFRHVFDYSMEAWDACYAHVPDAHRKAPIEADVSVSMHEGSFGAPFQFARLELMVHPTMNRQYDTYFKQPKSIQFYNHQINLTIPK